MRYTEAIYARKRVFRRRASMCGAAVAALVLVMLVGAPLADASAARRSRDACGALDAACVVGSIEQHVGSAEGSVSGATDEAGREVEDAVGRVSGELGDAIDAAPPSARPADPAPRGDGSGDGGGGRGHPGGRGGAGHSGDGGRERRGRPPATSALAAGPAAPRRSAPRVTGSEDAQVDELPSIDRGSARAGDAGLGAAHVLLQAGSALALPLGVLLACLLVFVLLHHRVDRNDPRLRVAELKRDMLRFR